MSKFKQSSLAVAVVLGLGLSAAAAAYTIHTGADTDPMLVATADIVDADTNIGVTDATLISLTGSDFILGRTTGFTIRINLSNGATFGDAGLLATDLAAGADNASWIPTIAAGGADGDDFVVINMDPSPVPVALTDGELLIINAADSVLAPTVGLALDDLTALQTKGAVVSATFQFVDPVTAAAIMAPSNVQIIKSGDPVVMACDATNGDTFKKIDVGANVPPPQAAKTWFSTNGGIGALDSGYMNMGTVEVEVAAGFASFGYLGTDEFTSVLTGDFSAFDTATNADAVGVFLSLNNDCSTQDVMGDVDNAAGTVTFEYTGADVAIAATGFSAYVCAEINPGNAVVIDDTTAAIVTTFVRGDVESTSASCNLLPLRYNGSVVEVYHVNPAGNTTAQSFIRVINPSNQGGTVTIVGTDDDGHETSEISFMLGAGESMQVNSEDLENGNAGKGITGAWGDGHGKWRATVTGEFAGMRVQGLNRNATDGTVTNLTDADGRGEQVFQSYFDNN